ncbi:MAG TPA: ATPase domain-containing protein [archaeon]|nr:ATPase domain-containing protein [archaeon]
MNRVSSSIKGLDELLDGGLPEKHSVLLSGTCGTGKTIFGLQFLLASKSPCVFVTFEDEMDDLRDTAKTFGWEMKSLEASNKVRLLRYDPFRLADILEVIENNIREIGATRVVLDSVSALGMYMKDAPELRRTLLQIVRVMKKNSCTTIITSEVPSGSQAFSRFGVEEFVTDGVIVLGNTLVDGEFKRTLHISKMRNVNHSRKLHIYNITENGFVVTPKILM